MTIDEVTIKAIRVERDETGKAKRVWLAWGIFELSFIDWDGKIVEMSRMRLDGARICDRESLSIPPAPYKEIIRRAFAILKEKRAPSKSPR